jgi:1,2-diacylglycerol 3-alpha-glucosyltransferase
MSKVNVSPNLPFVRCTPTPDPAAASPLHVLMLSDVYFPRVNGVSTSIQTFRGTLPGSASGSRWWRPTIRQPTVRPIATDGILRLPSRAVPLDPEDRLMRWSSLADLDRRLANADFDLVHVQTPFAAHYAGLRLARARGIPCVATYHTHFEEYLFHYIRFLPKSALRLAAARPGAPPMQRARRRGGAFATDGRHPARLWRRQTAARDSHRLAGASSCAATAPLPRAWDIAPERKVALFVGRAAFEKNIGFLLEMTALARRQRPNLMLVIAGEGPALPATCAARPQALRIEDHVRFVGYLPRDGACATAMRPPTYSPSPRTPKPRAWSCSKPWPSACRCWPFRRWARRRSSSRARRIAAADTPEGFAEQLVGLLNRPTRLLIMADEAIAFAREWDAASQGARLAALYRRLPRAPPRGRLLATPGCQPMNTEPLVRKKAPSRARRVCAASGTLWAIRCRGCTRPIATKTPSARKACWRR